MTVYKEVETAKTQVKKRKIANNFKLATANNGVRQPHKLLKMIHTHNIIKHKVQK